MALAVVIVVFAFTTHGQLLATDNVISILDGAAQLGIVTVGVTLLMIGGEFDLSVGETFVLSGAVMGILMPQIGIIPALIVALLAAAMVGVFNAVATVVLGLPSFIATLGSFYAVSGIILILNGGEPVTPSGTPLVYNVLDANIGNQVKLEVLWWVGIALCVGFVLQRTRFGNRIFATGGDRRAADRNGVRTPRVRITLFILCAVLAGFAGIIQLADIGTIAADAGDGLQLEAIAAAVIGGASLFGGIGGIADGVIGSIFLTLVSTALILSGASPSYYELFVGLVLVGTVWMHLRASGSWAKVAGRLTLRRSTGGGGRH